MHSSKLVWAVEMANIPTCPSTTSYCAVDLPTYFSVWDHTQLSLDPGSSFGLLWYWDNAGSAMCEARSSSQTPFEFGFLMFTVARAQGSLKNKSVTFVFIRLRMFKNLWIMSWASSKSFPDTQTKPRPSSTSQTRRKWSGA